MEWGRKKLNRILFLPDSHVPYHDPRAFALVFKVMAVMKFQVLALLGDFMDFYMVSDHLRDPRRLKKFTDEVREGRLLLKELAKYINGRKIYIHGNHEYRLNRYLMNKAPELYELFMTQDLLGLEKGGWEEVPYKEDISIGKIIATHDVGKSGVQHTGCHAQLHG